MAENLFEAIPVWANFKALSRTPGDNLVRRCQMEENTVFVFGKGKRRYGQRYSKEYFNKNYMPIREDKTEQWHKSLRRALKCLEESGLWADLVPIFQNMLKMTYEDHRELKKLWSEMLSARWNPASKPDEARIQAMKIAYPFAFDGDVIRSQYTDETSDCVLKSMYFGSENGAVKEALHAAIESKEPYDRRHIRVNYDVSVSYNPEKGKAWYSEEYQGCSNGHYYLALNEQTALFCEND